MPPGPGAHSGGGWRTPPLWRAALAISRPLIAPVCRLEVTGTVGDAIRRGPAILAVNHIGAFDPFVVTAACARVGLAPRILATGGLFRAPLVGAAMRAAGHIRVNRREAGVTDAFHDAAAALAAGAVVMVYPEGRISLDPGLWPERGKTGLARLAAATGAPVVPVSQWGAHEVLPWGAPWGASERLRWAIRHRPAVRVHFGAPIDLSGIGTSARAVREATNTILDAIVAGLAPLRAGEPRLPRWTDPMRPLSAARTHRRIR